MLASSGYRAARLRPKQQSPLVAEAGAALRTAWGPEVARRYVRFVYANEPLDRLHGIGERVRAAL